MPIIIKRDTRRGRLKSNDYREFRLFNNKKGIGTLSYFRPSEEVNKETLKTKDFGSVYKEYVYNPDKTPGYLSATIPDAFKHNIKLSDVRQGLKDLAKKFPKAATLRVYRDPESKRSVELFNTQTKAMELGLIYRSYDLTPKIIDKFVTPKTKALKLKRFLRDDIHSSREFKSFDLERYRK